MGITNVLTLRHSRNGLYRRSPPSQVIVVAERYSNPVTYRSLAVAIAYLENLETENLSFVYESLESNNSLQAAGACAALYMRKIVLKDDDFEKIMTFITMMFYLENIRGTIAPFMFIWLHLIYIQKRIARKL